MHKVFLSYSSQDKQAVDQLAHELSRQGISYWRDQDRLCGYIFIHRLVMEHFASLKEGNPQHVSGLPSSQEVQERAVV
jgi:hypothetical protein